MEGVLDWVLRELLSEVGGVDRMVTEFVRVTDKLLPDHVFHRYCPELRQGGRTLCGTPVFVQLLGGQPEPIAENAARVAELGAPGIDLNFGCPANIVNRHGGGAALLDEPETIFAIVSAVRRAVPAHLPVSAKMRLGYHDDARALDCARAIAGGGAGELVVHARTKAQAYRPPAYWERIADIREVVTIPVVANGEIWTVDDARRCIKASGCDMLMLGRGAVADPGLGLAIKAANASMNGLSVSPVLNDSGIAWLALLPFVVDFWQLVCSRLDTRSRAGRLKQWLNFLRRRFPEAETAYQALKTVNDPALIDAWLAGLLRDTSGYTGAFPALSSSQAPAKTLTLA